MIDKLIENIAHSHTAYHTAKRIEDILIEHGFSYLSERDIWKVSKDGKYYCQRNESTIIAFTMGERFNFNIVSAHIDSPCLKIKGQPEMYGANVVRLNTEPYGGPIFYSFMDRRLNIAGRTMHNIDNTITTKLICSDYNTVIPSLAIHQNRDVNNGYKFNPQVDLTPILSMEKGKFDQLIEDALSYDLFLTCAERGYTFGANNEFICAPRLDDLQGAYGALEAFLSAENGENINVLALFDSEEIGSSTRQGAGSTLLYDVINGIGFAQNKTTEDLRHALIDSFMISLDNAHAKHPSHPHLSDPTVETLLGGGIVIKNHANYNYTTDAYSTAHIKRFFDQNEIKYQDFYSHSNARCGSTLGVANWSQLGMPSIDLGLPQLAMHSAMETASVEDYQTLITALKAFFSTFKL